MKKIIKYYANLEMNVYIFFGIQMFIYMVICYVNNVESISISMIAQVFLVSLIMGILNDIVFETNIIKERLKIYASYIINLLIIMLFISLFLWDVQLNISMIQAFVIYTISYVCIAIFYGIYLKIMGDHYTKSLILYKERRGRL